jgi:hypothetical protein
MPDVNIWAAVVAGGAYHTVSPTIEGIVLGAWR